MNSNTSDEQDVGSSVDVRNSSERVAAEPASSSSATRTCHVDDEDDVSSTNIDVSDVLSFSSTSSCCCRICQLGGDGSNESLTTSRCLCLGHLAKVHHTCLSQWVRYRGSNRCEICSHTFLDIPAPPVQSVNMNQLRDHVGDRPLFPEQQEFLYYQALEVLRTELPQYRLSRRKRTAVTASIIFLFLITGVAGILTLGASRDFQKISNNPWASVSEVRKNHIVFAITLSFSFFCATLTLGLALMWLVLECFYYYKRRQILQLVAQRFLLQRRSTNNPTRQREGVI